MTEQDEQSKQNKNEGPRMITTSEAAERLGVTTARVRALAQAGRIKARKFGKVWMIDSDSVDEFEPLPPHRPRNDELSN